MKDITPFSVLFERFYRRIEKDESFFEYHGINMDEAKLLAEKRAKGYLIDVLDNFSYSGDSGIDFNDYDDVLEQINFKLLPKEKKLIVDLMFQEYMEKDIPTLHAFELDFCPSDLDKFSPANERNSYMNLIKHLEEKNRIAVDDYKSRERLSGKLKNTINYSAYADY